jgi:hypothetical protein
MQKRGHKYNPSISMKLVQERGSNFEEVMMENVRSNASKKYKKCTSRAKSNSPEHYYRTLMNSREIDYSRMPQKSVYNDRRSYRSNSTFNNLYPQLKLLTSRIFPQPRNLASQLRITLFRTIPSFRLLGWRTPLKTVHFLSSQLTASQSLTITSIIIFTNLPISLLM